jgi:hypothetical protein
MANDPFPKFASDAEETLFWQGHSSRDYLAEAKPSGIELVDARPDPPKGDTLELDAKEAAGVKAMAAQDGCTYREQLRRWVTERLAEERVWRHSGRVKLTLRLVKGDIKLLQELAAANHVKLEEQAATLLIEALHPKP